MVDVKLIRYKYSGGTWVEETGANALTYTFDPKPSKIDKSEAVEWRIRHSGRSYDAKARWRRRQTVKYTLTGSMSQSKWKKQTPEGGFEDIQLYRKPGAQAYAYKFECDLTEAGKTEVVVVESSTFSQDTKRLSATGEPWFDYKINLTRIQCS